MFKNLTKKRLTVLLVSLSLILVAGIGVTLAYVFASTGNVTNTFTPSKVACAVVETIDGVPKAPVFGDEAEGMTSTSQKNVVRIMNTGDTTAYIRADIIVTWKKADGTVYAQKPVAGTDYYIEILTNGGWELGADGYYYYTSPVVPVTVDTTNCYTGVLINQAFTYSNSVMNDQGYYVSIEIVASAIQSTPTDVVTTQWKSGVSGVNGTTLTIIKPN